MSRPRVLVFSLLIGGCYPAVQRPAAGVAADGQPLAIVDGVEGWTTLETVKVEQTEHRDSMGVLVATSTTYQEQPREHVTKIWYAVQGSQRLTDEDFFRIAGDQRALDATLEQRARGASWKRRGQVATMLGSAGMIANLFITPLVTTNVTTYLAVWGGSSLLAIGGYAISSWGRDQMKPETHAVDRPIAEQTAHRYNHQLPAPGLNVTGRF